MVLVQAAVELLRAPRPPAVLLWTAETGSLGRACRSKGPLKADSNSARLPIGGKLGLSMMQPASGRFYGDVLVNARMTTSSAGVRLPLNRSALSIRFAIN